MAILEDPTFRGFHHKWNASTAINSTIDSNLLKHETFIILIKINLLQEMLLRMIESLLKRMTVLAKRMIMRKASL